jgi:hypothetical protein
MFGLDPEAIAKRALSGANRPRIPGPGESITRGTLGFMVVAAIGFAPWAIFEKWFRSMRETQLYIACTAAFIVASGPLLHRLIIGPGSLSRFYKLFALAFLAYAGAWILPWVALRGDMGEFLGLCAGSIMMGGIVAFAFRAKLAIWLIAITSILVGNLAGYYAGSWFYHEHSQDHRYAAMTAWGVCYGLGFGAGLGYAFFVSQSAARARLRSVQPS